MSDPQAKSSAQRAVGYSAQPRPHEGRRELERRQAAARRGVREQPTTPTWLGLGRLLTRGKDDRSN